MDWTTIIQIASSLVALGIVHVGVKITRVAETLEGIRNAQERGNEQMRLEHENIISTVNGFCQRLTEMTGHAQDGKRGVMELSGQIRSLSGTLTKEMRGIIDDHNKHAIQQAKMERDLEDVKSMMLYQKPKDK